MPVHVIVGDITAYYGQRDESLFLSTIFGKMKYGWHTFEKSQLIFTSQKLREFIDKIIEGSNMDISKRNKAILYGDKLINVNPSTEAHQKVFFLIQTFNAINSAIKNETTGHFLLVPDFDVLYEIIFQVLKNSQETISAETLIPKFGAQVTGIINDLTNLGVTRKKDNHVSLTELAKDLPFLIGKGSSNGNTQ
ncbi:MAG: hypothetical protein O9294_17780 [Cytophagales bacterium]|jgi:hypothetical protein|nr:hypothetical protein [Cytophagales bacterium]